MNKKFIQKQKERATTLSKLVIKKSLLESFIKYYKDHNVLNEKDKETLNKEIKQHNKIANKRKATLWVVGKKIFA